MRPGAPDFRNETRGFTLVEVLVAILVFALGVLAINRLQMSTITTNTYTSQLSYATNLAHDRMDGLLSLAYDAAALNDTNLSGTNQDSNSDGIDDDDQDNTTDGIRLFGLNLTGASADFSAESPSHQGTYTISWNVAVNVPIPETKTVRVIVQWRDRRNILHTVSVDGIKGRDY